LRLRCAKSWREILTWFIRGLRQKEKSLIDGCMFSHVVIFWTDPAKPGAPDQVVASAKKHLAPIPGVTNFHVGKMERSHRDVVDQSYQVGLNIQFESKKAQDEYQDHPLHLEFIDQCKALWTKVVVYDFE
jgi:Stress responsive A/B Barrel Domain